MAVNRSNFLLIAAALSAGGVAGAGCDTNLGRAPAPQPAPLPVAASVAPAAGPVPVEIVQAAAVSGAPACDDSQGTPEECPSVGPSDEGVCPSIITKRCNDFKVAMKPRVAAQAVACLRTLKGNERCDATRINQCGHAALMSACQEVPRPQKGEFKPASGTLAATVTIVPDPTPDPSPLTAACSSILRSCGEKSMNPTLADCRLTLAGMTDVGRANMVDCVSTHCADLGLHGCEAMPKPASGSTVSTSR